MTIIAKFEQLAEKMFTGAFKKNPKPVQPVEIAKRLVREMQQHKRVSVSAIYVPNVYKVYLNPEDWSGIGSFATSFSHELAKYLLQQGQLGGYTFVSHPLVEIEPGDLATGQIEVVCEFDESIVPAAESFIEPVEKREATLVFADKSFSPETLRRESGFVLEVVEGPDAGKRFQLSNSTMFLGRQSECELYLEDIKVSRRHATLAFRDGEYFLDDLGSTNGTFVNGRRIGRTKIIPGDRVSIGNSVMELRVI
ncbi:MAG TPA: DUF3662 and FHA domain-containing protein [Verrucomicrobiae bacterium]|nr:DUF3662 and FHA domain-containing protein [Verrucomicrobiae bacterium]